MLKFIILSIIASAANALVPIYGQCGGNLWTGDTQCAPGTTCQVQNEWYHQCLPGGGGDGGVTTQPTQPPGPLPELPSGFPGKNLKIGISWDGVFLNDNDATFKKYDYISIWINSPWGDNPSNTDFNPYWTGAMIEKCLSLGKTPLFYAYVIAFEARAKFGYQDCDVHPTNNLCYYGAKFIKENRNLLVSRYTHQAKAIAAALKNRNAECIFVIEPDFWQYYGDHHTQQGGTLSGQYMRELYDDFAKAIRAELPNAKLSWDLSAWIGEAGMTTWWGFFKTSPYIDFVHTSGGQGQAGSSSYKPGELAWSAFSRITGKRIIADCGYGIGGGSSGNCGAWNKDNTQARINDGVVALSAAQGASQNPPSLERLPLS